MSRRISSSKNWPLKSEPGRPTVSRASRLSIYQHGQGAGSDELQLIENAGGNQSKTDTTSYHAATDAVSTTGSTGDAAQTEERIGVAVTNLSTELYHSYHRQITDTSNRGFDRESAAVTEPAAGSLSQPMTTSKGKGVCDSDERQAEFEGNRMPQLEDSVRMTKSINLELGSPYETGQRDADLFGDPGLSSSSSRRLATLFHEEQQQTGGGGGTAKKRDDTDLFGDPTSASTVFRGQQIVGEEELDDSDNNHFVATSLDDDPKEDDDHVGGGSNVPSASSAQEILQTSATVDQVETHIPEIRRGPVLRFNPLPAINTSGDKNQLSDEVAELWSGPINRAQNARLCSWILAAIAVLDFVICLTVVIVKTVFDKEDIPRAVVVWLVLSTVLLAVAIMMIVWAVWYQRHTHRNINDAEEFIRSIHPSTKTLPPTPQAHGHGEAELTAGGQDSSDRQQENPYQNVTGGNDSGKFVANSMSTRQLLRRSQESLAAVGEEGIELAQLKSKMPPSQTMNSFMSEFVSSYAEPYSPLSRTSAAAHNTTPTTHQRGVPSVDIIGGKATGL